MGLEDFLNEFKDYINKPLPPKTVKYKTGLIDYCIPSMLDLKLDTVYGEIQVLIDVDKNFSALAMYKDGTSFFCELWLTHILSYTLKTFEDMANYCEHTLSKFEVYKHTSNKNWVDKQFENRSIVMLHWKSNDNNYLCQLHSKGKDVLIRSSVQYPNGSASVVSFWGNKDFIQENRSEEWFLKSLEFALNKQEIVTVNPDGYIDRFYDEEFT